MFVPISEIEAVVSRNKEARKGEGFVVHGDDGEHEYVWIDSTSGQWVFATQAEADVVCMSVKSKSMRVSIRSLAEL